MAEIPMAYGGVALIDDADLPLVSDFRWREQRFGNMHYAVAIGTGKKTVLMHRLILPVPHGRVIDHINRNGMDNRRCNLREATVRLNLANRPATRLSTTGYKGVNLYRNGKYRAVFGSKHLGYFDTAEEAARAYDSEAVRQYGEFAYLNFRGDA
jgi:hypothetical protein